MWCPTGIHTCALIFCIIFLNDMFNISNVLFNVLYADDTCIYLRGNDITALFNILNVELKYIMNG